MTLQIPHNYRPSEDRKRLDRAYLLGGDFVVTRSPFEALKDQTIEGTYQEVKQ